MEMDQAALLYDEDCGFCSWSVARVARRDRTGSIRMVPLQSEEADRLLGTLDLVAKMASAHLVTSDGRIRSGGALVEPLFRRIRGGRPVAAFARSMPGTAETVYRLIARHRETLGRMLGAERCRIDREDHLV